MVQDVFPRPFGRYTLLANLAQGGMGALYLACQGEAGLEKLCVIKTVLPQLADKEYVARFRDEAKVVVKLSHGNLVPVFDAGTTTTHNGEEIYLAMEYVDGRDLRAVWNQCARRGVAFPVDVAVYIAKELCRGLHHAHSFGSIKLVHRDVSPPNVLISYFGEVKLTDFGLAASTLKVERTAPGVIYGKVSYMSPEQARGEALDGRTDLYAIGIILWELLTGKQLFPQSEPNLIERVRDPHIDPPSLYAPRVPPALDALVMKALAKDRTLRYVDGEAFRAALAGFLAQTAPTTDNARVSTFLQQLFGEEIEAERNVRQQLLDDLAVRRAAAERAAAPAQPADQTNSQPVTVSLAPKEPSGGRQTSLVGTYLDGRYLVKRLIGEGGMGMVYEAEHLEIGRRVAIKVLHAMYTRQNELVARFRSEARAATRIGHPHIIDVFDSGTTVDGAIYFVMEFLEGRDLAQVIHDEGPLPVERAVAVAREICQALGAAHTAGILHRDMKPENVFLVERNGRRDFVKVLDFGIAKTIEEHTERVGRLTNPGVAMGTPEYMAPEQAAGHPIDARADVYAVGAIVYEMLCARPPHEGGNIMEVLTRKATLAPQPLETLRPDVPRELERLIMRTLAIAPELRPPSMEQLAKELGALSGNGATPRDEQPVLVTDRLPRTRTPMVVGLGLGALLLIGSTALVARRLWRPHRLVVTDASPAALAGLPAAPPPANVAAPAPAGPTAPSSGGIVEVAPAANAGANAPGEPASTSARRGEPAHPTPRVIPVTPAVVLHPGAPKSTAPTAQANAEAHRLIGEGREALRQARFAQAEELFNRVRSMGMERGAALTGLAEVSFQRGDYPQAVRLGHRAVEAGSAVQAHLVLGNSYFKLGRYDEAIGEYREVLRVDRGHTEARQNLAAAEKRKGG